MDILLPPSPFNGKLGSEVAEIPSFPLEPLEAPFTELDEIDFSALPELPAQPTYAVGSLGPAPSEDKSFARSSAASQSLQKPAKAKINKQGQKRHHGTFLSGKSCLECWKAKVRCSGGRPCKRCKQQGRRDGCVDRTAENIQRPEKKQKLTQCEHRRGSQFA